MASLAQYLLHLSQNKAEHEAFTGSLEAARASMTAAGLSAEQQEIALGGDAARIAAEVQKELQAGTPEGAERLSVAVNFCICPPTTE